MKKTFILTTCLVLLNSLNNFAYSSSCDLFIKKNKSQKVEELKILSKGFEDKGYFIVENEADAKLKVINAYTDSSGGFVCIGSLCKDTITYELSLEGFESKQLGPKKFIAIPTGKVFENGSLLGLFGTSSKFSIGNSASAISSEKAIAAVLKQIAKCN